MSEPQVSEVFGRIAKLGIALGVAPLNKLPGCWQHHVDEKWWIALNGHKKQMPASSENGMSSIQPYEVDPFHCYVEYNGWLAGVITPTGGIFSAGSEANEDSLIDALIAATKRAKGA